MMRSMRILIAAALGAAASMGSGISGYTIDLLNRSQEPPPSPKGFGGRRKRVDKAGWKDNLRRATAKRGGSRPVARGR
jgi:hypothetical protein